MLQSGIIFAARRIRLWQILLRLSELTGEKSSGRFDIQDLPMIKNIVEKMNNCPLLADNNG